MDPTLALAEYLVLFFENEIGRLTLSLLKTGSYIPNISQSKIESCLVAIPKLDEQKMLIYAYNKLAELNETVTELQHELSLNPKNANVILDKFESIQGPLKSLTEEDKILSLIRKGEGLQLEFKETFSKNIRTNKKEKEIEKSSLKNIIGLLNAEGGTLLIGINDEGTVTGIEDDFFKSNDAYLLNFKNALKENIGAEFFPLIKYDIVPVLDHKILRVDCHKSNSPCYYNETEFYVRTSPATDKLEGKKMIEYIQVRFPRLISPNNA